MEARIESSDLTGEEKRDTSIDFFLTESSSLRSQRAARKKITANDFDIIKVIGKGAFGEVRIVREKATNTVFAMKTMIKKMMIAKNQMGHIVAERDLMADADNPWLVKLFWAFQVYTYMCTLFFLN